MKRFLIASLLLWSTFLQAGLPPTSSKGNGESVYSTTFRTNYDTIPVTRSGTTLTIGTIPIAKGGTGSSSQNFVDLTTGQTIAGLKQFSSAVGIGGTANASALLDVQSTTKAFMPPRMTTAQKNSIASPSEGMVVYDTDLNALSSYSGSVWSSAIVSPGTPVVPGVTTELINTFSFSYGTTNASTSCTASPCSYLDQIGTAVSSVTRSGTGIYAINTARTYTKLKCGPAFATGGGSGRLFTIGSGHCTSCSSLPFQTHDSSVVNQDSYGTFLCQGSY